MGVAEGAPELGEVQPPGAWLLRAGVSWLFLLLLQGACSPPDRPPLLPGTLPGRVAELLDPTELRTRSLGPGLHYHFLRTEGEPWAIHLLRVETERCELGLKVLAASGEGGAAGGRLRTSELLKGGGTGLLAAVNGDFFSPEGLSLGTEVQGGEVRRVRPSRPALAWRPGRPPWMGFPREEGDSVLAVGWAVSRRGPDGLSEVVGGFPLLLARGERVGDLEVAGRPSFAAARHPRTAVGWDPRGRVLWVVVVDGRQAGHSEGMSLPELASLLEALDATEALNLDGGGSSVMVVRGVAVSRPSDAGGERPVVNALAIRRDPSFCAAGP